MLKLMKGEKHLGRARSLLSYDYLGKYINGCPMEVEIVNELSVHICQSTYVYARSIFIRTIQ